ncbi:cyclic nucleotide-binding domain-containing protein [Catalinimonas niigatensis]|uniref:cyclic nucleotide-binding domain-containing protein n=1 Tax=Catalinimonas niigatensis TaxID=1397264 RepID=UPI00266702CD|nr:cyclic nucleotide-binding domain-containing protein [Catalinimonas niigatensis]WPP49790.1 cyclic nucleotide-binding domain-containing protein [Catalinimonas niigatensis]
MTRIQHDYKIINYQEGQIVFHEGHAYHGLFYIEEGKVKLYKCLSDGREQMIRIAGKEEFIGYASLFSYKKYKATAAVVENAAIAFIPRQDLLKILGSENNEDLF